MQGDERLAEAAPALPGDGWAGLLERTRAEWLADAVGGVEVIDLATVEDQVQALGQAPSGAAIVWIKGLGEGSEGEVREGLRRAVERGVPVVVGLPGEAAGRREALALQSEFGEATLLAQELAVGSWITDPTPNREAALVFVCANLQRGGSMVKLDPEAMPLASGHLARLEKANRALREANVRLARQRLGVHDAAASAVVAGLEQRLHDTEVELAQQRSEAAEQERQAAHYRELYEIVIDTLEAPRYRAVDSLRNAAFRVPGVRLLLRARRRRIQEIDQGPGSAKDESRY